MAVTVGTLLVNLGLESRSYQTGLRQAEQTTQRFEGRMTRMAGSVKAGLAGMLAGFSVGALVARADEALQFAGSLGEVAAQTGVTTRTLQEYRFAASQAGISTQEMDALLARLTRTMGSSPEKFAALGISIRDANGQMRDAGDVIPLMSEALQKLPSDAERAAALVDLLGRSGQKLAPLLNEGAAGINRLREEARAMGVVLSDEEIQNADKTADKITAFREALQIRINANLARNAGDVAEFSLRIEEMKGTLISGAAELSRFFRVQNEVHRETERLFRGAGGRGDASLFTIRSASEPARGDFTVQARRNVTDRRRIPESLRDPSSILGPRGGTRARSNTRNINDTEGDQVFHNLLATVTEVPARAAEAAAAIRRTATASVEALSGIEGPARSILDRLFPEDGRRRAFNEDMAELDKGLREQTITTDQHAEAVIRLRREYQGLSGILRSTIEEIRVTDIPPVVSDADIERLFLGSVRRGADGVEAQNVRIVESFAQLSQRALSEFDKLGRGIRSGNVLDILSGVIGALDAIGGFKTGGLKIAGLTFGGARANGGPVSSGRSYLVGEGGPELFTPRGSGAIVSNDRLGGGSTRVEVIPSPYFTVVVDGRVQSGIAGAAPAIAGAGSAGAVQTMQRRQSRRVA